MTFMLVGGGLDLSVGSVFAGGGIVSTMVLLGGAPIPIALAAGIGTGVLVGVVNALLVVRVGIPALIVTLAMIYIARGAAQVVTGGGLVPVVNPTFEAIGRGSLFGIPFLVIYALVIGVVAHVVLEHTRYGYHVRAVGGNRGAARAAGIRVGLVSASLYVTTGCAAALAGTLMAARLSTGDPNIGVAFEISVISAAIIGGTSLFGGIGTIAGTALGSILLGMMTNGLVIMGVDPLMQNVFVGIVILVAVFLDLVRRRRNARAGAREDPGSTA
jgi:ribose transport system permease protein